MKKKGFTLIELLVVIAIIAMLMAILMPALSKVKKIAARVVCGTNLKGLGTAQTVYANDYDDEYVVQGRGATGLIWTDETAQWQLTTKDWGNGGNISVGASLYLLVREADVSPKSFVCPSSDQEEFDGKNTNNLDIVDLWDFGTKSWAENPMGPTRCVSYAYHMPYAGTDGATTGSKGRYVADGTRSAAFAVMADKSPFFDDKLDNGGANEENWTERVRLVQDYWTSGANPPSWQIDVANSQPHDRESQNVLFADGHTANEKTVDVGVKNDGIYTQWANSTPTEAQRRQGTFPSTRDTDVIPRSSNDSVLVNDDLTIE